MEPKGRFRALREIQKPYSSDDEDERLRMIYVLRLATDYSVSGSFLDTISVSRVIYWYWTQRKVSLNLLPWARTIWLRKEPGNSWTSCLPVRHSIMSFTKKVEHGELNVWSKLRFMVLASFHRGVWTKVRFMVLASLHRGELLRIRSRSLHCQCTACRGVPPLAGEGRCAAE